MGFYTNKYGIIVSGIGFIVVDLSFYILAIIYKLYLSFDGINFIVMQSLLIFMYIHFFNNISIC
jgi:hypothetical protein